MRTTIKIEIEVEVSGNYRPEHSTFNRETPPEYSEFDIHKVELCGIDITEKLEAINFDFAEIEIKCLNEIEK